MLHACLLVGYNIVVGGLYRLAGTNVDPLRKLNGSWATLNIDISSQGGEELCQNPFTNVTEAYAFF